jgi:hypothetical protein
MEVYIWECQCTNIVLDEKEKCNCMVYNLRDNDLKRHNRTRGKLTSLHDHPLEFWSPLYTLQCVTELWSVTGGAECINRTPEAGVADISTPPFCSPFKRDLILSLESTFSASSISPSVRPFTPRYCAAGSWPINLIPKTLFLQLPPHFSESTPFHPSLFVRPQIHHPEPRPSRDPERRDLSSTSSAIRFRVVYLCAWE